MVNPINHLGFDLSRLRENKRVKTSNLKPVFSVGGEDPYRGFFRGGVDDRGRRIAIGLCPRVPPGLRGPLCLGFAPSLDLVTHRRGLSRGG